MAIATTTRKIPTAKREAIEEFAGLIKNTKVVGIAKAEGIGAKQVQRMRKLLEGNATLKVAKNTIMRFALNKYKDKDEKPKLTKLEEYLTGSNIFIFATMDPFKLTRILEKNKMNTLAKPGQIAPKDIVVPAGNTGFPPGPLITEFTNVGLPTRIESGNITITKDTVVAKKGDTVSKQLALVLSRLGIEPIEVGLELEVAYEDGLILQKEHLKIDVNEIKRQFTEAASQARNLAINIAYPTPETIHLLLQKAYVDSMRLAEIASFATPETMPSLLRKAYMQMVTLATKIGRIDPSAVPQDLTKVTAPVSATPEEKKPETETKKPTKPEKKKKKA